jgi:hypothetical protein
LIDDLTKFRDENKDHQITKKCSWSEDEMGDFTDHLCGFRAHRLETDAEVAARIAGYVADIQRRDDIQKQARREQYERLRKEFE